MTILFNKIAHEFDTDPELGKIERSQPLSVEPCDDFVMLTQWDGTGDYQHCILVERGDVQELVEALLKA